MYEFGEELIIESYKVPWLIWIQLMVMILLVLLLFFGFTVLDDPTSVASSSSSSSQGLNTSSSSSSHGNPPCNSTGTLQIRNQNHSIKRETEASTSHDTARPAESQEKDGSAEQDATIFKLLVRPQHPCNYFGLAKQAVLKCLGFDSDRDNCNTRRHAKED